MEQETETGISYVVPVYNEAGAIDDTIERLHKTLTAMDSREQRS